MELQDKLNKKHIELGANRKDRNALVGIGEGLVAEIAALEAQIADSEVTYSIGDRFKNDYAEYLLAEVGDGDCMEFCMIDLKTGVGNDEPKALDDDADVWRLPARELFKIDETPMVRCWDSRKQEKC